MPGQGYSASGANANATPQAISAGTVFNFNSTGTSFDGGTQSQTAIPTATAAAGGSSADSGANPNQRNPAVSGLQFLSDNPGVSYGLIALIALAAGIFIYKQVKP